MESLAGMRAFVRAVDTGSFSAAGRLVGAAPSSVSRQIGELEADLGATLFHRTTRKISLTEAGEIYYRRAARFVHEIDEARLAVNDVDGAPTGILRITVAASLARLHVAPALVGFHARHRAVDVVLSVTDRMVDIVDEGFDLAIRVGQQRDSSLIARRIGVGRRIVAASPAYLKSRGTPRIPRDLSDHDCLTFRAHPGANVWRFRGPEGAEDVRVSGCLFADDGEALVGAAAAGLGLVLLPEWLLGHELAAGRLTGVLDGYRAVPEETPLYAVHARQLHMPPKTRAFIDFLAERFTDPAYSWSAD